MSRIVFTKQKTYTYIINEVSIAFVKLFGVKVCVCWKLSYLCTPIREKAPNFYNNQIIKFLSRNAYDSTTRKKRTYGRDFQEQVSRARFLPTATRCLRSRLHDDPKEA